MLIRELAAAVVRLSPERVCRLVIVQGSVTDFQGDALVNAANPQALTGGGVDGAITLKGGSALAAARRALPIREYHPVFGAVRCPIGSAVRVGPEVLGELGARYVILAVGPDYRDVAVEHGDHLLDQCYREIIRQCETSSQESSSEPIRTLGCPLISSGIFRGSRSLNDLLILSLAAVKNELILCEQKHNLESIYFFAYLDQEVYALHHAFNQLFPDFLLSD